MIGADVTQQEALGDGGRGPGMVPLQDPGQGRPYVEIWRIT